MKGQPKVPKELLKKMNKKPTYREEANALTHQCFRNSFIEDLHAGKYSKLLENESLSRITQKKMKKLMIETSAELAKFLEMKDKKSKNYKKVINGITLFYTDNWEKKAEIYKIKRVNAK